MKQSEGYLQISAVYRAAVRTRSLVLNTGLPLKDLAIAYHYLFPEHSGVSVGLVEATEKILAVNGEHPTPQDYSNVRYLAQKEPLVMSFLALYEGVYLSDELFVTWEPE